ncbi:MAG: nucleotidyltransferase family protein [Rhodoferax sp.]|nr:nucleotidyltransferase family protein [Rhodoferax sp.]
MQDNSPTPDLQHHSSLAAVLMAAGAGARMGQRPKSLLELDGMPLICRQVMGLRQAGVAELVLVLGHHAKDIQAAVKALEVSVVINPDPDAGPVGSQRLGLQSLSGHSDAVLMALADQPLLDAADLRQLVQAFHQRPPGCSLLYPRVAGQPGNPVIFTAGVRAALLACPPEVGCKNWRQAHTSQVQALDCDNLHFVQDVDTPDDIAALRRSSGRHLQWPAPWQRPGDT